MENKKREFHTVRGYALQKQEVNDLTPGMEDYLEMIYRNCQKEDYIRISTLSERLNVKASSATRMVQKLTALGLISYEKYGIIMLTKHGKELGKFLLERHKIIETFLTLLGTEENILKETELIEHHISEQTLYHLRLFNLFMHQNPDIHKKLIQFKNNFTK